MKRFPHYLQHDAMDCGPTCLRMIAKYYGKNYSLQTLRERSFITREGVSMLEMKNFIKKSLTFYPTRLGALIGSSKRVCLGRFNAYSQILNDASL